MSTEEHILVVPATALGSLGNFEGFCRDDGQLVDQLLAREDLSFRPRGAMEQDPSFKQLIPYVLLECTINGELHLFRYTRGSGQGEARLHAKFSLGIGGHISREDADSSDPYRTGMQRELDEEVVIDAPAQEERVGMIYDPSTDVGRVHLGIVHRLRFEQPGVRAREADLLDAGFVSLKQIVEQRERFETWSQLCLDALYS